MIKWKHKKSSKYFGGTVLALGITLGVCSCIRIIDPVAYTQAVLDVSYKNITEQYIELTGAEKEDAEQIFQNNLDTTSRIFKNAELTETLENNYSMLFKNIIMQVRYTVGESEKTKEGNYIVEVSVEPMTLFDDTYELFQEKSAEYARNISNSVMGGAQMPTEEEMKQAVYQIYYDILKGELDAGPKYGAVQKVQIHVNRTENGTYEIPAEDIRMLDTKLISQEKLIKASEDSREEAKTAAEDSREEAKKASEDSRDKTETAAAP